MNAPRIVLFILAVLFITAVAGSVWLWIAAAIASSDETPDE